MKDREIDEILARAAGARPEVDPALLDRVSGSITSRLAPVRPLPPKWALAFGLVLISAAIALAGGLYFGIYGLRKLGAANIAVIFPALGIFAWVAAMVSIGEMTPGSRRRVAPVFLLAVGSLSLSAIFAMLFHDYRVTRFVPLGIRCLATGLLHAIPAGFAGWLLLRRGFAVNRGAAGLATGILAGLAGVTMLELHCPNFEALHIIVWHTAVIPASGAAGALLGWGFDRGWRAHK